MLFDWFGAWGPGAEPEAKKYSGVFPLVVNIHRAPSLPSTGPVCTQRPGGEGRDDRRAPGTGVRAAGTAEKQRDQNKRGVWEHQDPVTPSPPKGAALILFRGAPRPGNRSIRLVSSPGRPPRARTCESNVRLATHPRARVRLFAHARTRAYASPKYISRGRGEAAGPSLGPLGHCARGVPYLRPSPTAARSRLRIGCWLEPAL